MEIWQLPPCLGQREHEVGAGVNFCSRCGLVIKGRKAQKVLVRSGGAVFGHGPVPKQPPPKPRRPRRPQRHKGLPESLRDLIDRYGFDLVEQVLYEQSR